MPELLVDGLNAALFADQRGLICKEKEGFMDELFAPEIYDQNTILTFCPRLEDNGISIVVSAEKCGLLFRGVCTIQYSEDFGMRYLTVPRPLGGALISKLAELSAGRLLEEAQLWKEPKNILE